MLAIPGFLLCEPQKGEEAGQLREEKLRGEESHRARTETPRSALRRAFPSCSSVFHFDQDQDHDYDGHTQWATHASPLLLLPSSFFLLPLPLSVCSVVNSHCSLG